MTDFAAPWIVIPPPEGRGIGPVCCARCHQPVPDAEPGMHACACGARESRKALDPRFVAICGEQLRDLEELTDELAAKCAEIAALKAALAEKVAC